MRQFVFAIFLLIGLACIAAVAVLIVGGFVRNGLSFGYVVLHDGIPNLIRKIIADPWFGVALVIAALLVWCFPWEHMGDEHGGPSSPVRRGRTVHSLRLPPRRRSPLRPMAAKPAASRTFKSAVRARRPLPRAATTRVARKPFQSRFKKGK